MQTSNQDSTGQVTSPGPNATGVTVASILLPGLGQLINGDTGKGVAMIAATFVFWYLAWPLALVLCAWSAFDAYTRANELGDALQEEAIRAADVIETQITATAFVSQIEKIAKLAESGMLDAEELTERKQKVIANLKRKTLVGSSEDFLTALIPLMQSDALSKEELTQVKSLLPS
jgi:TM2 domain-containing membrane protein YozV